MYASEVICERLPGEGVGWFLIDRAGLATLCRAGDSINLERLMCEPAGPAAAAGAGASGFESGVLGLS